MHRAEPCIRDGLHGARGETVRVRNLESKRDFAAKVTAENRAEVRF